MFHSRRCFANKENRDEANLVVVIWAMESMVFHHVKNLFFALEFSDLVVLCIPFRENFEDSGEVSELETNGGVKRNKQRSISHCTKCYKIFNDPFLCCN